MRIAVDHRTSILRHYLWDIVASIARLHPLLHITRDNTNALVPNLPALRKRMCFTQLDFSSLLAADFASISNR